MELFTITTATVYWQKLEACMTIRACFVDKNKISYYKDFPVISEKFKRISHQEF